MGEKKQNRKKRKKVLWQNRKDAWGDRRDATLLRDVDSLHFIMGIIYPNRADNEAYIAERVNLEPIKEYIATKNYEGIPFKYTLFPRDFDGAR